MKVVRILTNAPSPYRNHQFRAIHEASRTTGDIDFAVWFTAHSESHGRWAFRSDELGYPHEFFCPPGGHPSLLNDIRCIPSQFRALRRDRPDLLIIGGYLNLPNQVACTYVRAGLTKGVMYFENHAPFRHSRGLMAVRRFMVRPFDLFVVPGAKQEPYVRSLQGGAEPLFHRMPNVVDESVFNTPVSTSPLRRQAMRSSLGLKADETVILTVMRLDSVKGSDLLISAARDLPPGWRVVVAGEGPLRRQLEDSASVRSGKVMLLGHVGESRVVELLSMADWFALPSRNDPYPLCVVEALWAGLPLLVSSAVGCHPEALVAGENGLCFEADSEESLAGALRQASALDLVTARRWGARSRAIAEERFDTHRVSQEFLNFCRAHAA